MFMDVRVQRKYWITKMRFCITLSDIRWTLILPLMRWRKIHCKLHWAIASVSQNAHWYFQKFLKCSQHESVLQLQASSCLSSGWIRSAMEGLEGQLCSPHLAAPECPGDTAHSLCMPEGSMSVEQAPKTISPPHPFYPYWCTGVRHHDLGLFSTPLCWNKTKDVRDKLDLEGERWD